jgi:hypothetical protein
MQIPKKQNPPKYAQARDSARQFAERLNLNARPRWTDILSSRNHTRHHPTSCLQYATPHLLHSSKSVSGVGELVRHVGNARSNATAMSRVPLVLAMVTNVSTLQLSGNLHPSTRPHQWQNYLRVYLRLAALES